MATVADYAAFFLATQSSIVQLELLEISHPSFSQTYRLVRNAINGITVTHESPPGGSFVYTYTPMRISSLGSANDMDQAIKIEIGDLGEIVPAELDRVSADNKFTTKPIITYRTYSSFDLTAPLFGPLTLSVDRFTFNSTGVVFEARASIININRTGELYYIDRFPMLEGFARQ